MAKVHPLITINNTIESSSSSSSSSSSCSSSSSSGCCSSESSGKRESFTVWMKSLVMQGNGCTVYDESGEIVYRVDNYDEKNSDEVFLMDLKGKVLFTILRKRMWVLSSWEGYKSNGLNLKKSRNEKPLFQVKRSCGGVIGKDSFSCKVRLRPNNDNININNDQSIIGWFRLEGSAGKSALKIIDNQGRLVAEAKRKQSSSGVILGDDVLTLVIQQSFDRSLVMALVTVYGLMHHKL